ncbi:MAG: NAD-dependent epimerase/dehydratase family protein [Turicibacter sp.]|nr:NAD-dependent epimerase/dehydratase family protein [Turicibacter sp.]
MKILITGINGYIAKSLASHNKNAVTASLRNNQTLSFAGYDAVIHTVGIAHKRATEAEYYRINTDLAVETAQKCKAAGVKQFIFLSSISVYGITNGVISAKSPISPANHYAASKISAELSLEKLADDNFKVAILRLPMVYGKAAPGNYRRLERLVKIIPIFPDYKNVRSLLHIDTLCRFIDDLIKDGGGGLYFPKDDSPISTCDLVRLIALENGKKIRFTKAFNWLITLLMPLQTVSKMFGSLVIAID